MWLAPPGGVQFGRTVTRTGKAAEGGAPRRKTKLDRPPLQPRSPPPRLPLAAVITSSGGAGVAPPPRLPKPGFGPSGPSIVLGGAVAGLAADRSKADWRTGDAAHAFRERCTPMSRSSTPFVLPPTALDLPKAPPPAAVVPHRPGWPRPSRARLRPRCGSDSSPTTPSRGSQRRASKVMALIKTHQAMMPMAKVARLPASWPSRARS